MSYDISLELPAAELVRDPEWGNLDVPLSGRLEGSWRNYTSNVAPMWRAAGVSFRDLDGVKAGEAHPTLVAAIDAMKGDPDRFRAMNPENGWGNYEGALDVLEHFERWCRAFPDAQLEVSA